MTALTPSDVETWLDDNSDWLCDYLQRRKSVLGPPSSTQSLQTVPAQSHTIAVNSVCEHVPVTSAAPRATPSSHQQHQQHQQLVQRVVTIPTRSPDYTAACPNVFIMNSESPGRRSSSASLFPSLDTTSLTQTNSKRHLRRHFARSRMRMTEDPFSGLTSETSSASFDWFVPSIIIFSSSDYKLVQH